MYFIRKQLFVRVFFFNAATVRGFMFQGRNGSEGRPSCSVEKITKRIPVSDFVEKGVSRTENVVFFQTRKRKSGLFVLVLINNVAIAYAVLECRTVYCEYTRARFRTVAHGNVLSWHKRSFVYESRRDTSSVD